MVNRPDFWSYSYQEMKSWTSPLPPEKKLIPLAPGLTTWGGYIYHMYPKICHDGIIETPSYSNKRSKPHPEVSRLGGSNNAALDKTIGRGPDNGNGRRCVAWCRTVVPKERYRTLELTRHTIRYKWWCHRVRTQHQGDTFCYNVSRHRKKSQNTPPPTLPSSTRIRLG